ncbi:hypothetical protein [Microbaculum marinum]|uniref:Uncharacterized protein n=1 Tax=Microbaculum marinum TaxID=1764581 RepID=A0AAW9RT17_9HYPH
MTTLPNFIYTEGTIDVEAASAEVVANDSSPTTSVKRGDSLVMVDGTAVAYSILAVAAGNAGFTLDRPWEGSTDTGLAYMIVRGLNWLDNAALAISTLELVNRMDAKGMLVATEAAPESGDGDDEDGAILAGPPHKLYVKKSGAWQEVTAHLARPIEVKTANYTADIDDHDKRFAYELTTTDRTHTLPACSSVYNGFRQRILLPSTSTAKVATACSGADTFWDGTTSKDLTVAGTSLLLVSDGVSKWYLDS